MGATAAVGEAVEAVLLIAGKEMVDGGAAPGEEGGDLAGPVRLRPLQHFLSCGEGTEFAKRSVRDNVHRLLRGLGGGVGDVEERTLGRAECFSF